MTESISLSAAEFSTIAIQSCGEIIVSPDTMCFLHGTRILTPIGEKPVETLRIGDAVVTRFGGIRHICWIGRQSYDLRFIRNNPDRLPVRIRPGALGPQSPARDLFVSSSHSLLLGDTLVFAGTLVNGITITQALATEANAAIEYYQLDLGTHDCVIAEGAWAESFADAPGLRNQFHNAPEFAALFPQAVPPETLALCAPRPDQGAAFEASLRPVVALASRGITPGRLEGYIDAVTDTAIEGWALDHAHPNLPVTLEIRQGADVIGTVLACGLRADLRAANKGTGRCAFSFPLPAPLAPAAQRELHVHRAADGAELPLAEAFRRRVEALPPGDPPSVRLIA